MRSLSSFSFGHFAQITKALLTRRFPIYAQFVSTNRCLFKCAYCDGPLNRSGEAELNLEAVSRLADNISKLGVVFMVITGGEPLTRADLEEVVGLFAKTGMITRLQTTGIGLTEKRAEALFGAGLDAFSVSLDTLNPGLQNRLCGVDGVFEKIMIALSAILRKRPADSFFNGVNIVATRENLEHIPGIVAFCSHVGLFSSIIPIHSRYSGEDGHILRTSGKDVRGGGVQLSFEKEDEARLRSIFATVTAMKRRGHTVINSYWYLSKMADYLVGRMPSWRCDGSFLYLTISSSGRLFPCVDVDPGTGFGNAANKDFTAAFHSKELRRRMRAIVNSCDGCFYPCYPEWSRFVRSPSMMWERFRELTRKVGQPLRPSAEELVDMAGKFTHLNSRDLIAKPGDLAQMID